jgi:hypothetical protein
MAEDSDHEPPFETRAILPQTTSRDGIVIGGPRSAQDGASAQLEAADAGSLPLAAANKEPMFRRFLLARRIKLANDAVDALPPSYRGHVKRARLATECAQALLEPSAPWREGSGAGPALRMFGDAAYWAMRALPGTPDCPDLPTCWRAVDPFVLVSAAGDSAKLDTLRSILIERDLPSTYEGSRPTLKREARTVDSFVEAILARAEEPLRTLDRLRRWRALRLIALFVTMVAIVAASAYRIHLAILGPDLARGKLWRTSSQYPGLDVAKGVCDGILTTIFFHTQYEDSPWFEVDLARPTRIKRVEVGNRIDSLQERAVPLVVELSLDHVRWTQVGKRDDPFDDWTLTFPPRQTRYVRLRTLKPTWLHLRSVVVR